MPITQERQTMQDLRSAGFSQQQAEVLAAKLEATAQATQQDLKDFIREQMGALDRKLDAIEEKLEGKLSALEGRINVRFAGQEARFEHSLRMQMATILTAIIGVVGLAVAIIKLFPNAH
jgi:hypothetical protein